jgi:F-type H+-transporting ATPase subunit beta
MNKGRLVQVIGSVFDAQFEPECIPAVYNALEVQGSLEGGKTKLYGEVQQHLGSGRVRAISFASTLGLRRGMEVIDTGAPLMVPVGLQTLGRVFNLLGEPIDQRGAIKPGFSMRPIHRDPPKLTDISCSEGQASVKR